MTNLIYHPMRGGGHNQFRAWLRLEGRGGEPLRKARGEKTTRKRAKSTCSLWRDDEK